jgi:hypothetical protein
MRARAIFALAALLIPAVACHGRLPTEPGDFGSTWLVERSFNAAPVMTHDAGGWVVSMPGPRGSLNYLLTSSPELALGDTIEAAIAVEASPDAIIGGAADGTDTDPATAALIVIGADGARWWHGASRVRLDAALHGATLVAELRPDEWTDVGGRLNPAAFERAVALPAQVGITGWCYLCQDHGVDRVCPQGGADLHCRATTSLLDEAR